MARKGPRFLTQKAFPSSCTPKKGAQGIGWSRARIGALPVCWLEAPVRGRGKETCWAPAPSPAPLGTTYASFGPYLPTWLDPWALCPFLRSWPSNPRHFLK